MIHLFMCEELKEAIEQHLLTSPGDGWVKGSDLAARFDLRSDRVLRKVGDQDGLCSDFAISSDRGFKHIARASTREWLAFKHRMRNHAIAEMVRTRNLDRRRSTVLKSVLRPPFLFQKDTGQGVML
jgi:hypothetical protein